MEYDFITNIESCHVDVPTILYYSHIPTTIIILFFGIFLLFKNRENKLPSILLFLISLVFSVWTTFDIVLWLTYNSVVMMTLWSLFGILYILIYILSLYFIYTFIDGRDISLNKKWIFLALLLPIILLSSTKYNLPGFDIENCQPIENIYFNFYQYSVGIFIIIWIMSLIFIRYKKAEKGDRKQILFVGLGILLFLAAFSWSEIAGSVTENFEFTQYGLFGAPIFIGFLVYSIVKFKTFNIKVFSAQALVWALVALIGSQFFFIKIPINFVLNGIGFVTSTILGQYLIKSVKKEIEQKEKLAELDIHLENLIKQRESLVHLVTHKVKGSFTRTKFLFAGMLDGTFGEVSPEIKKRAKQGLDFDDGGIKTVDLVLNAANMQNGLIKYDMKNLDFKELVLQTISEKRIPIEEKGLKLETEIKDGNYTVFGDPIWLKEVVNNLIENSFKYTKEGKIIVGLERKEDKLLFSVKDTGVGITAEDKQNLFKEGGRGAKSVEINVDSTGYGLFTVKLIIEAHKGKVWVDSEGENKGSQFYVELPTTS